MAVESNEATTQLSTKQLKFVDTLTEAIISRTPKRIFGREVKKGSRLDKLLEYITFAKSPEPNADLLPHGDEEREL